MLRRLIIVFALALVFGAGAAAWWIQSALAPVEKDPSRADVVSFEVAPGDSLGRVARSLEAEGLVRDARAARWYARAEKLGSELKVGEYALSRSQSTPEILGILAEGRVRTHAVVIPEGLRATEIADRLAEAGLADREAFLEIVRDPETSRRLGVEGPGLEGYLFPDTYRFARGLPAERIAAAMVEEFRSVYRELEPEARRQGLSMRELVTLASIVEKETGVASERPLIASVFLNRIDRGMRLETDPTVIYGIPDFDGNLKRVHLEDPGNPYNTYRIRGLPPGPIASPGRAALEAVLAPADSPYLYFVSRNDGTHVFSKTYAEHTRYVDRFQRRGGR
ncbi:MAG: endolytic transglycosylase MltG [bacterium]